MVTVHGHKLNSVSRNKWEISNSLRYLSSFITSLTQNSGGPIFGCGPGVAAPSAPALIRP